MPAVSSTGAPALSITLPSTVTWRASISARARSRGGARPLSTISTPRRTLCLATLVASAHDPVRDRTEPAVLEPRIPEDRLGLAHTVGGHRPRRFKAEERRITGFGACRILARAL